MTKEELEKEAEQFLRKLEENMFEREAEGD